LSQDWKEHQVTTNLQQAAAEIETLAASLAALDVVDLSPTLRANMPRFTTHPELQIAEHARTIEENGYRLQTLVLPEHVGAHVDAPAHVVAERPEATVDTLPPTALWGRAVCVDVSGREWQPGELLSVDDFMRAAAERGATPAEGDVVLVNFGWSRHLEPGGRGPVFWSRNTPGFTEELCRELRDLGVRAVCSDSATCDCAVVDAQLVCAYGHDQYFLPHDIYIIECLENLGRLPAVSYFAALPLKIQAGSGSPLRPVAFVPRA
jgi:kynurenine formamidase